MFSSKMGSATVKEIYDPIVPGDAVLGKNGGTLLYSHGKKIFHIFMANR
jgi:hypothetical protein